MLCPAMIEVTEVSLWEIFLFHTGIITDNKYAVCSNAEAKRIQRFPNGAYIQRAAAKIETWTIRAWKSGQCHAAAAGHHGVFWGRPLVKLYVKHTEREKKRPLRWKILGVLLHLLRLGTWNIHGSCFATPAPWRRCRRSHWAFGTLGGVGEDNDPYPTAWTPAVCANNIHMNQLDWVVSLITTQLKMDYSPKDGVKNYKVCFSSWVVCLIGIGTPSRKNVSALVFWIFVLLA